MLSLWFALLQPHYAESSPASMVEVAKAQIGKHDHDCKGDGCFHGRGQNWCSEFVSWARHEARVPFDGGNPMGPSWLLKDAQQIIRWYQKNGKFVRRGEAGWASVHAEPGDYALIGRVGADGALTSRRHSGIVEFEDAEGGLHTIEGNNHHRPVQRFVYPRYKSNSKTNGAAHGIILGLGSQRGSE